MSLLGRNISNFLNSVGVSDSISVNDYKINGRSGLSETDKVVDDKELGPYEVGVVHRKAYGTRAYIDRDILWKEDGFGWKRTVTMLIENANVRKDTTLRQVDTDFHMSVHVEASDLVISPPEKGEVTRISFMVGGRPVDMKPVEIHCDDKKDWLKRMDKAITDLRDMGLDRSSELLSRVREPKPLFIPAGIDGVDELLARKEFYDIKAVENKNDGHEVSFVRYGERMRKALLEEVASYSELGWLDFLSQKYKDGHLLVAEKKGKVLVREVNDAESGIASPKSVPQKFVQIDRDVVIYKPWGEDGELVPQVIRAGGYLNVTNRDDVYGIAKEEFEETYSSRNASTAEKTCDAIDSAVKDIGKRQDYIVVRVPASLIDGQEGCRSGHTEARETNDFTRVTVGGKTFSLFKDRKIDGIHYSENIASSGMNEYGESMMEITFAPTEEHVEVLEHIGGKLKEREAEVNEWMKDVVAKRETVKDTAVLLDSENTDTCLHVLAQKDNLRSDNDSVYLTTLINNVNAELQGDRLDADGKRKALDGFVKEIESHRGECYVENGLIMEKDEFCVSEPDGKVSQIIPVKGVPGVFIHMSQQGMDASTLKAEIITVDGKKMAESLGNTGYTVKERTNVIEYDRKIVPLDKTVTYDMANGKTACDVRMGDKKESSLARSADRQKSLQQETEQNM